MLDLPQEPEEVVEKVQYGDDRKASLMGTLLKNDESGPDTKKTFQDFPLPEERSEQIRSMAEERRLARRMNRFLQISFAGLRARMDIMEESDEHRLAHCLDLKIADLFIAETISDDKPIKLLGEWLNEIEHPRDSGDGLLMMKMVTWHPAERVTEDYEIANDESHAVLHILPLRCHIHQRAVRFGRAFFTNAKEEKPERVEWAIGLKEIPSPLFQRFKVKVCKMKVDYTPEKIDVNALRDGAIVELVNLSPLNDMVITLQAVVMESKVGFGSVLGELVTSWIRDICDSQLYKFVINTSPFQPITGIGNGVVDMVVLPWDAIRNGDDVMRALKSGFSSFASCVAYETLNASAKLTNLAAKKLVMSRSASSGLPPRPHGMPRGLVDTAGHALESIAKGVEEANYKVVIIPYREFQSKGAGSAAKSVMKGLPVAILAPVGGASEALSYTLLGARNLVRPDIRKEEEASQRGLQYGDF
jgi:autophagy-related protein 2